MNSRAGESEASFRKERPRAVLQSRNCAPIFRRGLSKATRGPFRCSMGSTRSHGSANAKSMGFRHPKQGIPVRAHGPRSPKAPLWPPGISQLPPPHGAWTFLRFGNPMQIRVRSSVLLQMARLRLSARSTRPCSRASLNLLSQRVEERHMSPTDP